MERRDAHVHAVRAIMKEMRIHKSGHEIRSVEEWLKYAPPKKREHQWEDKRSAKELAQAWCGKGFACPPEEMGRPRSYDGSHLPANDDAGLVQKAPEACKPAAPMWPLQNFDSALLMGPY